MSLKTKNKKRKLRRKERTSAKVRAKGGSIRVSVFRSLKQVYGQVIDDAKQTTIVASSTAELKDRKGDKKELAKEAGLLLAQKALEKGITNVAFDRGQYRYHGRVKAFAEGLRQGGLQV
ncbi:50S ribosomal protein L18 [candidate division TM6 bacterium RIFCSPHIGHO2_12_FULL_36_22]|nr:MAG: 50S ribosomal protein L18 [candidate division TM6 bacterium RIFCSPHIGHO2_12_FULL_36_22]